MMSRLPTLERAFGQDDMARRHRLVGFSSFTLMMAHIVLITWGSAAGKLTRIPATFWNLSTDYPGMLLAVAGTGCLVMVVATSVKAARAKVRYESWHLIHLYAYLGVGLALPHQLWTGQEFLFSAAATIYWWTLWAAAGGAVLVWRVGLPLWRSARHRLRVTSVVPEGDGAVSVYMTGRQLHRLRGKPDSSSAGGSWVGRAGPAAIRTRCQPPPMAAASASPSRPSAAQVPGCQLFSLVRRCSSRVRTDG